MYSVPHPSPLPPDPARQGAVSPLPSDPSAGPGGTSPLPSDPAWPGRVRQELAVPPAR